jgi:hypothetical protein
VKTKTLQVIFLLRLEAYLISVFPDLFHRLGSSRRENQIGCINVMELIRTNEALRAGEMRQRTTCCREYIRFLTIQARDWDTWVSDTAAAIPAFYQEYDESSGGEIETAKVFFADNLVWVRSFFPLGVEASPDEY